MLDTFIESNKDSIGENHEKLQNLRKYLKAKPGDIAEVNNFYKALSKLKPEQQRPELEKFYTVIEKTDDGDVKQITDLTKALPAAGGTSGATPATSPDSVTPPTPPDPPTSE